jgi:hypothetical protein
MDLVSLAFDPFCISVDWPIGFGVKSSIMICECNLFNRLRPRKESSIVIDGRCAVLVLPSFPRLLFKVESALGGDGGG